MKIFNKFPTIHFLLIDILLSLASFVLVFSYFKELLTLQALGLSVFIVVRVLFLTLFETQKHTIKLSNQNNLKNLLFSLVLSTLIMFLYSRIEVLNGYSNHLNWIFYTIEMSTSFLFLTSRRIIFSSQTNLVKNFNSELKNAVIVGTSFEEVKLYEAISKSKTSNFNVIAFIDPNKNEIGKKIYDIRIVSPEYLDKNHIKDNVSLVIFSKSKERSDLDIINKCFTLNIEVLEVAPIEDWINNGFSKNQLKQISISQLLGREEIQLTNPAINSFINEKIILVTGAAGSIGSELVHQILAFSPRKVILLDQNETGLYHVEHQLSQKFKNGLWEIVVADISQHWRIKQIFEKFSPHIVYHAAAYKHVPLMESNPIEAISTNVMGSINLIDLATINQVETFVFISTDKAVNPTNVMGATKRATEIYIQSITKTSSTKFVTTRFGNVLGSNGSVIPLFEKQIKNGGPLTITDERVTRFFMTINEACQLVLEASIMGEESEIFVFDMGESVKIIDLARKMIYLSGLKEGKDIKIVSVGLRPGEKLYEELLATEENTSKTHHPKILIGKSQFVNSEIVLPYFTTLRSLLDQGDETALVRQLKVIVPEFKSNNSKFSSLD